MLLALTLSPSISPCALGSQPLNQPCALGSHSQPLIQPCALGSPISPSTAISTVHSNSLALCLSAPRSQGIDGYPLQSPIDLCLVFEVHCTIIIPPCGILLRAACRRTENISLSQDAAAKASALLLANSLSRNQQQENDKLAARCADLSDNKS